MSRGLNKVQIIGRLGRDPEMRYTPQGSAVTTFSVATGGKWVDRDGNERDDTVWFRVDAWERLAETCNQYLTKGAQVYIEGRLKAPRVYTDRNGMSRAELEITASNMIMLTSKGESMSYQGSDAEESTYAEEEPQTPAPPRTSKTPAASRGRNQPQPIKSDIENDDEIPF